MAFSRQPSLLDHSDASPIASALEWINSVLFGQVAAGLCVLAVAFVGFQMLTGRWPLRLGFRVVLGCFVLLGAPVIAAGFIGNWNYYLTAEAQPFAAIEPVEPPRGDLEPADNSPYGGASLRGR
ncbi:TrbC/VirB2 family protein [uncultured Erythrobacter sp.]|uniref:TrbC/VirB2 family protein n=1 Tax=uncultured Erythrobacter sp. TaxID=263913 RepID=UPI00260F579A|nr:TrbC/VirB2 family protein [uncultured Erythrobacter sp.]